MGKKPTEGKILTKDQPATEAIRKKRNQKKKWLRKKRNWLNVNKEESLT